MKKIASFLMAVVLCVSLAVPAVAAWRADELEAMLGVSKTSTGYVEGAEYDGRGVTALKYPAGTEFVCSNMMYPEMTVYTMEGGKEVSIAYAYPGSGAWTLPNDSKIYHLSIFEGSSFASIDYYVTSGSGASAPVTPVEPEKPELAVNDVSKDDYYYDAVAWAVENGITKGTSSTTFSPKSACTRGQVVTFLWRAAGKPEPKTKENPFTDVSENSAFYKAILWAVENNITNGTSSTTFSPKNTCSGGHIITFLWRAEGKPAATGSSELAEANPGRFYTNAVAWAESTGLLDGTGSAFVPGNQSPRGDVLTYMYRNMAEVE